MALLGSACTKEWLQDYTADPARPLQVSVKVLLPSAQVYHRLPIERKAEA